MSVKTKAQEIAERQAELNARLADTLTEKGVEADASETTTALIAKVGEIEQGGARQALEFWARNCDISGRLNGPDIKGEVGDLSFDNASSLQNVFQNSVVTKIGNITAPYATTINSGFSNARNLEHVGLIDAPDLTSVYQIFYNAVSLKTFGGFTGDKIKTWGTMCYGTRALETIEHPLNLAIATSISTMFHDCSALRDVRFVAESIRISLSIGASSVLSSESVQSIVDGLADLTGGTTQTLTLHKNVAVSDEQKAAITLKNWTLVQ